MIDNRTPVKPCPFCKGLSMFALDTEQIGKIGLKQIFCTSCGAAGPTAKTEDQAAEKWNWRPDAGHENGLLKQHGEIP